MSSEPKHTKGPWTHGVYQCATPGLLPDAYAIWPETVGIGEKGTPIAMVSPLSKLNETDLANAALIAAAPDLLEVARMAMQPERDANGTYHDWHDRLRVAATAALAKAQPQR